MKNVLIFAALCLIGIDAKNVALVIGGYGGGNSVEIITENKVCSGTDSNPPIPNAPAGQIAGWFSEYAEGKVYLCGGQDTDIHKDCWTLAIGGKWELSCKMVKDRRFAASVVLPDESIVVLGGYNDKEGWLDSVEMKAAGGCEFVVQQSWTMPRKIFDFCAVALDSTHILIAGGSNPGVAQTANVDILNTETGEWTPVEQLPVARSAPGCILTEIDGEEGVMLTGGFNTAQGEHLYDSLFYRPSTGKWEQLEEMYEDRMGHGVFHLGASKKVTVVGGYNQQLMGGIEERVEGMGWNQRGGLIFPRYFYGSSEIPDTILTC